MFFGAYILQVAFLTPRSNVRMSSENSKAIDLYEKDSFPPGSRHREYTKKISLDKLRQVKDYKEDDLDKDIERDPNFRHNFEALDNDDYRTACDNLKKNSIKHSDLVAGFDDGPPVKIRYTIQNLLHMTLHEPRE